MSDAGKAGPGLVLAGVGVVVALGALGLIGFLWALRSRQYDDLEGAAARILFDDQPGKDPPP